MRLLDLFCGAGGAAMGYHRAGFDVVGVDINPQPHYPFTFVQGDAMTYPLAGFDAIHASPPCQAYSITKHSHGKDHPELVETVRERLKASGVPWVMENVVGAPMDDAMRLCGSMFDLTAWDDDASCELWLKRHRLFEASVYIMAPGPCRHPVGMTVGGVYGGGRWWNRPGAKRRGGYTPKEHVRRELMDIDWMTGKALTQAIPPAYTEWIGRQLLESLNAPA